MEFELDFYFDTHKIDDLLFNDKINTSFVVLVDEECHCVNVMLNANIRVRCDI